MSARAHSLCNKSAYQLALLTLWLLPLKALAQYTEPAPASVEPIVVSVVLNGTLLTESQLLYRELGPANTRIWIPESEASSWRMGLAGRDTRTFETITHVGFCGSQDRCFYDEASTVLTITLENSKLLPLRIMPALAETGEATEVTSTGGYLNYDVDTWLTSYPGASALLEGRIYSPHGHGSIRTAGVVIGGYGSRTLTQAVWQVDRPRSGYSIQAGSISVPDTSLGAGLPLTGLRIGSNASLSPSTSQVLRPRIDGLVDRSQRTDVFIDGMFRQTTQVPYGPYSIELQPQFPGLGHMDIISTDVSGVQTHSSVPYYYAPEMLTPGASEWSADVGVLASDGRSVGSSPPLVASATLRRGIDRELTLQTQVLAADGAARLTLAAETASPQRGASSAGVIWQRSEAQPQGKWWLDVNHEYATQEFSANIRAEQSLSGCYSTDFTEVLTDRLWRACRTISSGISFNLNNRWSISASIDDRRESRERKTNVSSLSARMQTGPRSQWGLSLQRIAINDQITTGIYLVWSQPLGNNYDGQLSLQQRSREKASLGWSVQSTPPPDAQMDNQWLQAFGTVGEQTNIGARWNKRDAEADWRVAAQVDSRGLTSTLGVSGAVGVAEGRYFMSRRINDAFIVVDVGLPNLPVLLDNREVARTNDKGWAIVTEGRSYQPNNVGVDTSALPIEYAMPRDQQNIVPTSAAGVLAQFDLSDGGISVPVRDAMGNLLPAGAKVSISTQRLHTAVTSRSEVFFERSDRPAEVTIEWGGNRCSFNYKPQDDIAGGYLCATLP
jgi:outer membrane usher protein